MKSYKHHGVEVIRQVIGTPFVRTLRNHSVDFVELPILEHHVLMYTSDRRKFALIVPQIQPDDYAETVYITSEVPIDGWEALRTDVEGQNEGKEPKPLQSRLKLFLDRAIDAAINRLTEDYPSENIFPTADIPEKELLLEVRYEMAYLGWCLEDMRQADSHDVDKEFLRKLIDMPKADTITRTE